MVDMCFSALQRAEIAEIIYTLLQSVRHLPGFSALQRAEIAEIWIECIQPGRIYSFSALQRAEIAEISKCVCLSDETQICFSALQRAEIAEIARHGCALSCNLEFQCSSTIRNC